MVRLIRVLIVMAVLAPALLRAQAPEVLTLEQALQIADQNNRDIQKAAEFQKWIGGKYVEERARALPQFNASGSVRRDSDNSFSSITGGLFPATQDTGTMSVSVSQPIYTWGKVGAAIKAAKFGFGLGDELLRQARQTARRDVTSAFYDVLLAQELNRIAQETEQQKKRQLNQTQQKFSLGTATDYDVLATEVDWKNSRPTLIRSANQVIVAKRRLLFLLGREYGEIDVNGSLDVPPFQPPSYEQVVADALKDRPELRAQHETVNIRAELIKIAKAGNKPSVDFDGSYGHKYLSAGDLNADGSTWGAGITMSFPFFDGFRTNGQTAQALSDWNSARIDEEKLREAITVETRIALDQVQEAREILDASADTVAQAEKLLSMAEKGYELGVKIRLEVDDALLNLSRARGSLAGARHDALVALTNLEWVRGRLGETR